MYKELLLILLIVSSQFNPEMYQISDPQLDLAQANRLAELPLSCIQQEYPNTLGQTLSDSTSLGTPRQLHPAFYGCFDWHSSVHGHWMLVKLLKIFPDLDRSSEARAKLQANITSEHIQGELQYFKRPEEQSYERTYGWAWLLKLAEELHTWEDPLGQELGANLQPLTDLLVDRYLEFLPKLNYPIRVGEHSNTAFGLAFAWDYAATTGHRQLQALIEKRAVDFYQADQNCPFTWEPSGYDFLSPCLQEIDIMRRVLDRDTFRTWLDKFMPDLKDPAFQLAPGTVSDRSDGKLVHLDGVNFSRAWCLYGLSGAFPEFAHLREVAHDHITYSLPNIVDGGYEGEHWLASFALYALNMNTVAPGKSQNDK